MSPAYVKDHKDNFQINPTTRLINPAKNVIGRISKTISDKINKNVRHTLTLNQWKNTAGVIEWFNNIQDKPRYKFTVFDIKHFYPSIKQTLLTKALNFAETHTEITKEGSNIIQHSRKSLLYKEGEPWSKKDSGLFDVTMGAYDGAEVCELVGTYLLYQFSKICDKKNVGLPRDDGLFVVKDISGPQSEQMKKSF